jgi:hypothetical protein
MAPAPSTASTVVFTEQVEPTLADPVAVHGIVTRNGVS